MEKHRHLHGNKNPVFNDKPSLGFGETYRGKRVLVTGHTGFKGSWLCIWLKELGAQVIGYALEAYTERDNFVAAALDEKITHIIGDIRDFQKLRETFCRYQPEFVFHLAAQPIVRESYLNPKETYDINVGGTVNLLECCRLTDSVKVIVNVTSDKCYENREWAWGYRENDPLGGIDPYSSSKGCCELVTAAYRKSYFNPETVASHGKSLASARAGNVIGGGDWQQHRIIPDCIRALEQGDPIKIRNPQARRPWQFVLEPLSGYLLLAHCMYTAPPLYAEAWNFGPDHDSIVPVGVMADKIVSSWGSGNWTVISEENKPHEAKLLGLDISKANFSLGWYPTWGLDKAVEKTVEWYKMYKKKDPYNLCVEQIHAFQS